MARRRRDPDRPLDGVDQTALLRGEQPASARDHLVTFVGPSLLAARWKQWRMYLEEHNVAEQYGWVSGPLLQVVADYEKSLEQDPNPPPAA